MKGIGRKRNDRIKIETTGNQTNLINLTKRTNSQNDEMASAEQTPVPRQNYKLIKDKMWRHIRIMKAHFNAFEADGTMVEREDIQNTLNNAFEKSTGKRDGQAGRIRGRSTTSEQGIRRRTPLRNDRIAPQVQRYDR